MSILWGGTLKTHAVLLNSVEAIVLGTKLGKASGLSGA